MCNVAVAYNHDTCQSFFLLLLFINLCEVSVTKKNCQDVTVMQRGFI